MIDMVSSMGLHVHVPYDICVWELGKFEMMLLNDVDLGHIVISW